MPTSMLLRLVGVLVAAACGRIDFAGRDGGDGQGGDDDAGAAIDAAADDIDDDAAAIDAAAIDAAAGAIDGMVSSCLPAAPPPRIDVVGEFSPAVAVNELNSTAADDDPTLTADRLSIWLQSDRSGAGAIITATRPTLASAWSAPTAIAPLSIAGNNTPKVSPDGLRMAVSGTGPGGDADLFLAVRATTTAAWPAPTRLAELSSTSSDTGMAEFLGGYGVVFFSNRAGGPGGGDLWMAVRAGATCEFEPPVPVPGGVNTADFEANPWISYDGLVIAWQSGRAGGPGGGDVWWATRASITDPFGPASLMPGVNSAANDDDPWLSEDLRTLVFSSVRTGNLEVYQATR